jgi:UDP-3-O-[3-hydroxymyristoyl] glucosamine N-acyltransferase
VPGEERADAVHSLRSRRMQQNSHTVAALAERVGGRVVGDGGLRVERVSGLEDAREGSVVFIEDAKLLPRVLESAASCCITPPLEEGAAITRIEVQHPKLAFALAAGVLHPPGRRPPAVHPTAVVAPTARVHPTAYVGPHAHLGEGAAVGAHTQVLTGVYVGDGVRIGEACTLHPHVVVYEGVEVGDRVVLHAGAVVGADGFGYVRGPDGYHKFPQIGGVVIEDDVEVGANATIDRGALGTTRVGRGTKIDNLVMVAHNVQVGERVIMAALVGISGSTRLGDDVVLAGQVGLADHVQVGNGVQIGAKSAVFPGKVIPPGSVVMGIPARPLADYKQVTAHTSRLPRLHAEVAELRRELTALRARLEGEPPRAE